MEEQIHLSNVIQTFEQYAPYALSANNRRRKDLLKVSRGDHELLEKSGVGAMYKQKLRDVDECILKNASFLKLLVADAHQIFETGDEENYRESSPALSSADSEGEPDLGRSAKVTVHSHGHSGHSHEHSHSIEPHPYDNIDSKDVRHQYHQRNRYKPTHDDIDRLFSTLKQCVRDWSDEGAEERRCCYDPMLDALCAYFDGLSIPTAQRPRKRVLVPGAGLGRLVYEVAKRGFSAQGNEFSHYMLFPSFWILNRTQKIKEHTLYPYIHSFSNCRNVESLTRAVRIPDILPYEIPQQVDFSYVAGDFEEIYGAVPGNRKGHEVQDGRWDAVMTCFFIDTAKNIVNYLRIIHRLLAPDGVWINLGPLLWHFENNNTQDLSIEFDLGEVKRLARSIGFELKEERIIKTSYVGNSQSMLSHTYDCALWTATKVSPVDTS